MSDATDKARKLFRTHTVLFTETKLEVAEAALDLIDAQQNLIIRSSVKIDPGEFKRWNEAECEFEEAVGK